MLAAALLLAYAAATVVLAPIVLSPRRRWPIHRPRLALALWHAAFVTGGLAAIAAIVSLIELIADDIAAREVSPTDLANALLRLGTIRQDQTMRLRAERILQRPPAAGRPAPA